MRHFILLTFIFLSFTGASVFAAENDALPQQSLFLSQDEVAQAIALSERAQGIGLGDIRLGAIIYYAPNDWKIWLRGEAWTPQTKRDNLRVVGVRPDAVDLMWRETPEDDEQRISLRPNQVYQKSTKKIIDLHRPQDSQGGDEYR